MTNVELIAKIKAEIDKRYAYYREKMKTDDFTYYEGMADALDLFEQFIDTLKLEKSMQYNTTNVELIPKIKAEIERRLKDYWEISFHDTNSYNKDTNVKELKELLSFLSTLESEKPMQDGLEEETVNYCFDNGLNLSPRVATDFARHFAEWGYLRAAEKYNEIEYNRQMAEESVPNDLQEAANEHVNNIAYCGDDIELEKEQSKRDFITGAKWQKQHDAELIEIAYNDGITIGMTKQKEQMLKEAEECELYWDGYFLAIDLNMTALGYSEGDKVRIIIVKE